MEDILRQTFSNEKILLGQYDEKLIDFVKELSEKKYNTRMEVETEIVKLKKKYSLSPKKAHLGYIPQTHSCNSSPNP